MPFSRLRAGLAVGVGGATAATAITLVLALGHGGEAKAVAPPPRPAVFVSLPAQEQVTARDSFTGRLEAVDTVEIRPRVSGYIQRVAFRDGEIVHKGDLLFVIDPRPYQAAMMQAEGQLAQARSQLVLANQELARGKALITTQVISNSTLDQRQQAQQAAEAAVTMATGVLANAHLNLEFTELRAPIDGQISRRLVSEGNLVAGGDANATLLSTIVSLDPIDVYFDIDEASYLRYQRLAKDGRRSSAAGLGGEVQITLPGDESPAYTGILDFDDNRLDQSTGTLRARARIANPDHSLKPGQFVRVALVADAPHVALLVPDSALSSDATQQVLYVVGMDERVATRPVVSGRLFGQLREITRGLEPSDRVIVSGIQRTQPGAAVTIKTRSSNQEHVASTGGF
jgi:RND family efflux transporter MFP subunit